MVFYYTLLHHCKILGNFWARFIIVQYSSVLHKDVSKHGNYQDGETELDGKTAFV
jgi:hypothetical protein